MCFLTFYLLIYLFRHGSKVYKTIELYSYCYLLFDVIHAKGAPFENDAMFWMPVSSFKPVFRPQESQWIVYNGLTD